MAGPTANESIQAYSCLCSERLAYAGEVIASQNTTILNLRGEIAGLEKKIKELEKAHDPHRPEPARPGSV